MKNANTPKVVDLKLVGPKSYTNFQFFNRPIQRGEIVRGVPVERAERLLDLHMGEEDDIRYFFAVEGKARNVGAQRTVGSRERGVIEFEDDEQDEDAQAQNANPDQGASATDPAVQIGNPDAIPGGKPAAAAAPKGRGSRAKATNASTK